MSNPPIDAPETVPKPAVSEEEYLDALFKLYAETMQHARHQETARASALGFIITLTAASAGGLVAIFKDGDYPSLPTILVSLFILSLGIFGAVYVARTEYTRWYLKEGAGALEKEATKILTKYKFEDPLKIRESGINIVGEKLQKRHFFERIVFGVGKKTSRWELGFGFMFLIAVAGFVGIIWIIIRLLMSGCSY